VAVGAAGASARGVQSTRPEAQAGIWDVTRFGVSRDGRTLDTGRIQQAIDECARAGGGTVYFPPGKYLSGTLVLRSHVSVHLETGATLLGSQDLAHYPSKVPAFRSYTDNYTERSLLYAEKVEDIAIHGRGVIDGQGASFQGAYKVRPYLLRFIECRGVAVEDVTFRDSPMWVQHYLACEDVCLRGVTVRSRVNHNNDGIDIDCCRRVRISDCDVSSGDDAIVLKSTAGRVTRDVAVSNCVLSSHCNALKMGTESNGGFQNIAIVNCAIYDTRLAGIALEIVDGGVMDGVTISNVTMQRVNGPIFIRLGDRARPYVEGSKRPAAGALRNVTLSNIEASGGDPTGCAIAGLPGHPVEDVTLENVRLRFVGGGTVEEALRQPPEHPEKYPEYSMFGRLPAYAFYCRHIRGLRLRNIETACAQPDARPAVRCEDVEGLEILTARLRTSPAASPAIRLHDVRDALIQGCQAPQAVPVWLEVSGAQSRGISVIGNDLGSAERAVRTGPETAAGAVFLAANRRSAEDRAAVEIG
jgi:polygalacturonase